MLKDDAQRNRSLFANLDDLARLGEIPGDRLFHEDGLAGFGKRSDDVYSGVGWRDEKSEVDIIICRDFIERFINAGI